MVRGVTVINSQKKVCSRFGNRARSPSENDARFVLRNQRVTDGGWGVAISHLAVDVQWAPDPPSGEARPINGMNY